MPTGASQMVISQCLKLSLVKRLRLVFENKFALDIETKPACKLARQSIRLAILTLFCK